jgi:hypothetical protein
MSYRRANSHEKESGSDKIIRSDREIEQLICITALSIDSPLDKIPGCRFGYNVVLPHEQLPSQGDKHRTTLQEPMEDRTVLKIDQASLKDKGLLMTVGE